MKHLRRNFRAISPVLAVLMMIAVAIAGSLVVYAWVMGYIDVSNEKSGQNIEIQSIANVDFDLHVYVQNTGQGVVQLDEAGCLYVNGQLVPCSISGVSVSDDVASLGEGKTATLCYLEGVAQPGKEINVKVTTLLGISSEYSDYPAGTANPMPGSVMWARTYGGTGNESISSLIETSDGGYAMVGSTTSFGAGTSDVWLVKTDEFGHMEWNRTYGGAGDDYVNSLVATLDGGYAMVGYTNSFGAGDYDFWLIKTDSSGNMEWNQTYGEAESDRGYSLLATSDGGYAIVGITSSFFDAECWFIKTDANGTPEWNQTYTATNGGASSLVAASDGGYAIAGGTSGDFWLIKTDVSGDAEWNYTYGGEDWDVVWSLVVTSDGGYALVGSTGSFLAHESDCLLVKTDEHGTVEWNQTYEGAIYAHFHSLVVTSDGGYAITSSLGGDFWLVKTDAAGIVEWSETYGGTGEEFAHSLIATSDGGYAIAGYSDSFGTGGKDFWLIKIY